MNHTFPGIFWRRLGQAISFVVISLAVEFSLNAQLREPQMPPPAPRRPSIILIVADNIGYGDLGCYGQTRIKTPNLDQLAARGIRFTSFYAGAPQDAESRAALLTGLEPRHSRPGFNELLPTDALTLATFLKQQGYRTGLIGQWALGDTGKSKPDKQGFDDFFGFLNANHARDYYTDRIWRFPTTESFDGQSIFPQNENGKRGMFMPDLLSNSALNFVRINKPELQNKYRPFFLCLAYPIPHVSPNAAPPGDSQYADAPWPPFERIRATLITRMDVGIGHLLNKLDELKISTNTIVIFTSAGGPQREKGMDPAFFGSSGPFRGQQGSLNEGGLRVPFLVRWPAQIKPGGVNDQPWAAWDVFPTAAEIAYAKPPPKLDGISMLPTLLGRNQTNMHEALYWESRQDGLKKAVRMGEWKAIRNQTNQPAELYHLKSDPAEKENVAVRNPSVMTRIEKLLNPASQ
jgi:arylsulfatase A-like enzyme